MVEKTRWTARETDADLALMSRVLGISETTAFILASRGLRTKKTAENFLKPELLHCATLLKDAEKAVNRIFKAAKSEKIVIYGDYDVDGIMSTVILMKTLTALGANVSYYIPDRMEEGYGLNLNAVETLYRDGTKLIIAVDNGISAINEAEKIKELGMELIIIDHHEPGFSFDGDRRIDVLPDAFAIIDPKQADCNYPFSELCAAALSYKIAGLICKGTHEELLTLASIATLCDIMELVDENRTIVTKGLESLNSNKLINPGLGSLISVRGYLDKPIDTQAIGFAIGPCLNASGRLDKASKAVELLLLPQTAAEARLKAACNLVELNDSRKNLTAECVERVMASVPDPLPHVLVLTDDEAHESVAGIVAGRIREITRRPTILLTVGDNSDADSTIVNYKGSGRSIENYNIFEALYHNRKLFTRFGGHAMAAGLTLPQENIELLRFALNRDSKLTDEDFIETVWIDKEISLSDVTLSLSDELAQLAPFGKGNAEPLFVTYSMYAESVRIIDEKNTLIWTFNEKGRRIKGIAFGLNELYSQAATGLNKLGGYKMDAVYAVETNIWNNIKSVQMRIKDFRLQG